MAVTAGTDCGVAPPLVRRRTGSATRPARGGWFALGILAVTAAVLIGLFLLVRAPAAPSAYPGLNGFPKAGTLPSKGTGDAVTFVFAFIVGFLIQRSRWCNASAIRDAILFKSFRNTKPLLAAMMVITAMFTVFEAMNVGRPINIVAGAFTVLGLFLFGIGMVLGGACTVSVWIRSAEGSVAALWALLYTFVGMFLFSELWNVLRWPAANYLQSTKPNWSILSFGSFNAMTIRSTFGPVWGPVAVMVGGALQVAVLVLIYRRLLRVERSVHTAASAATAAGPATAVSTATAAAPTAAAAPTTAGPLPIPAPTGAATGDGQADGAHAGLGVRSATLPDGDRLEVHKVLDCSGEMCPRPQLLTKRTVVKEMDIGQILELIVDNPSSPDLVPTIMDDIGAVHLHTVRSDRDWKLYIRKERELAGRSGGRS